MMTSMSMKAHRRHACLQDVSCSPRASLSQSRHSSVDILLKNLKTCSRRLQIALETHANESVVLERLYYKGKNQHRGALFWRRLAEVRRYCSRLGAIRIDNVVEILRHSFFGEGAYGNPKLAKGSWTHFPDIPSMLFTVERLSATSALVKQMHARLVDAYRFFTLTMQSGAFLQLVLTVLALVSRLGTISFEVLEALQATSETIRCIVEAVSTPEIGCVVHASDSKGHDSAVSISQAMKRNQRRNSLSPSLTEVATNDPSATTNSESIPLSTTVVRTVRPGPDQQIPEGKAHSWHEVKRRIKKHNAKDEIDEIFGF